MSVAPGPPEAARGAQTHRDAVELAEALELGEREVIPRDLRKGGGAEAAGQVRRRSPPRQQTHVEHAVQERARVPVRQHEAVARRPGRQKCT